MAPQSREYRAWADAKQRVTNPNSQAWPRYGGRGIRMCEEWLNDAAAFLAYMGPRPAGYALDRIDNDGHYEPGNVRWASASLQNANQRQRQADSTRALWADPVYRARLRRSLSRAMRRKWVEPGYRAKSLEALRSAREKRWPKP